MTTADARSAAVRPVGMTTVSAALLSAAGVVVVLAAWLIAGVVGFINPSFFPTLPSVLAALGKEFVAPTLWNSLGSTLGSWALGTVVGVVCGLLLGSAVGLIRPVQRSAVVVIEFFKTVPIIAILPLAILVLGTSNSMKIALVAFGVTWPLLTQTSYGVRSVDPVVKDTATSLRLTGVRRYFTITLPSAAPFIATGLRIAAAGALILTIVVELVAGGSGLGVQITTAALSGPGALPKMYAYILITGVVGVVISLCLSALERRALRWHESQRPMGKR